MIVFVVGTARSGTCWLGRILASHPGITGTVEEEPQFPLVTEAALFPDRREGLLRVLADIYRKKERKHGVYAEKAHPALWIAEGLYKALPRARFLAIERNMEDVVRSMLKHEDVRARCESGWEDYPEPCPFLGLETREAYAALDIQQRCERRWEAHRDEVYRLRRLLGGERFRRVGHDALVRHPARTKHAIQRWLGLSRRFPEGVR